MDDHDFFHQIIFFDSNDDSVDDPDIFPCSGENNDSKSEFVTSDTDVDNEETKELDVGTRHSLSPSRPTIMQQREVIWEWGSVRNYVLEILEFDYYVSGFQHECPITDDSSEIYYFEMLFDEEIMSLLVTETNRYHAHVVRDEERLFASRHKHSKDTNDKERERERE